MRSIILFSALCLQLQWSYGTPVGVGAYAYQDSTGNRYGGTYDLKDGQEFNYNNYKDIDDSTTFGPNPFPDFQDLDSFLPEYFRNLDNFLHESSGRLKRAFSKNIEQQRRALDASRKAFELTPNRAGYVPNFDTDVDRFSGFPNFAFPQPSMMPFNRPFMQPSFPKMRSFPPMQSFSMPALGAENSAFAGGVVGPGYRHQMVALNPTNPSMPNIDVKQFSDPEVGMKLGSNPSFYSVQSSSFVSSSNLNGHQTSQKGGETIVNDNGKVTKYSLYD